MVENIWISVGLLGQALFGMRFLVQWISSERRQESFVPIIFWYFSLCGGVVLLSYALYKQDIVFIIGQLFGLIVYGRNLYLIKKSRTPNFAKISTDPSGLEVISNKKE